MLSYVDKTITCRDCGNEFVFTVGEQEFYAEKGFTNQPSRCPDCRRAAKASRSGGSSYGGGNSYSGGGYSERAERTMHPATCSQCGRDTMVPFMPTTGKPVYCSDCFRSQREDRGYGGNRNNW
jgi:CxxC-x17-CxxC domain-containing protein